MISSTCWVPRGYPSEFPEKYELDDAEIERIEGMANLNLHDIDMEELEKEIEAEQEAEGEEEEEKEEEEEEEGKETGSAEAEEVNDETSRPVPDTSALKEQLDIDDDLKEYDLEHYDDPEDGTTGEDITMFPGLAGTDAKFHAGAEGEDPYLSLPTPQDAAEERQELQIYPTDNMILASRTEDDISYLDVYVFDDGAGFHDSDIPVEKGDEVDPDVARGMVRDSSLYVHHDLMLPAFPLCIEWIDYKPNKSSEGNNDNIGNLAAIGTFDPQIEIWDLNCVEKTFPDMILGEPVDNSLASLKSGSKSKKNKKKSKFGEHITTHHTDAVLSLAHNKQFRSVLASTSADHTVKLWDLNDGIAARSMQQIHQNKNVSASQWHLTNGSVLLTAGYDSRVALSDVRISNESEMSKYWTVLGAGEEIETAAFADENTILCGTDSGNVYCFDIRNNEGSKPVWTLRAHDAGISTLSVNNFVPGMLVTGAMGERQVKLWQFPTEKTASQLRGPHMVLSRDFDAGNVLSTSFAPDIEVAGTMVIGGTNTGLKLWDVFTNRTVRKVFSNELKSAQQTAREEAAKLGRSSRFARKYTKNDNPDTVVTVEDQVEDDEDEDEE